MSEKLSLKWNDFQSNVSKSFGLLRQEYFLHDVTLVADDKKQISAHRLVLSACSEYFKEVLKNNAQFSHPLLCLNGVGSEDLTNILDYIYNGQVSIYPERLDRFLEVAQRFKLEGLLQNNQFEEKPAVNSIEMYNTQVKTSDQERFNAARTDEEETEPRTKEHSLVKKDVSAPSNILDLEDKINECLEKSGAGLDIVEIDDDIEDELDDDIEDELDDSDDEDVELEEQINDYLEKSEDGSFKCTLCGKTSKMFTNLKGHIETHFNMKLYQQILSKHS